jgi:hypothetical protein
MVSIVQELMKTQRELRAVKEQLHAVIDLLFLYLIYFFYSVTSE